MRPQLLPVETRFFIVTISEHCSDNRILLGGRGICRSIPPRERICCVTAEIGRGIAANTKCRGAAGHR